VIFFETQAFLELLALRSGICRYGHLHFLSRGNFDPKGEFVKNWVLTGMRLVRFHGSDNWSRQVCLTITSSSLLICSTCKSIDKLETLR
jgi:hypothetical protein